MKRRGFLAALAGLPFIGLAAARLTNNDLRKIAAANPPAPQWFNVNEAMPFAVTTGTYCMTSGAQTLGTITLGGAIYKPYRGK